VLQHRLSGPTLNDLGEKRSRDIGRVIYKGRRPDVVRDTIIIQVKITPHKKGHRGTNFEDRRWAKRGVEVV
jgi:hypothetical protein